MPKKRCPYCMAPMARRRISELEADGCFSCGGVWLDGGELEVLKLLGDEAAEQLEMSFFPAQPLSYGMTGTCPVCFDDLEPAGKELPEGSMRCPTCFGTWLPDGRLYELAGIETPRGRRTLAGAELRDARSFYIGDRVTWTQAMLLVGTAVVSLILHASRLAQTNDSTAFTAAVIVAIGSFVASLLLLIFRRRKLYFELDFWKTAALYFFLWVPASALLGARVDAHRHTEGSAALVAVFVAAMDLAGYYAARYLRKTRHRYVKKSRVGKVTLAVSATVVLFVVAGLYLYDSGMAACRHEHIASLRRCQPALVGIYVLFFGMGTAISMGINYFMLHCLFDPKGMDVVKNPPGELYLKTMIGSTIATGIAWLLLFLLLPPIAGGGGGGGKKSGSSGGGGGGSKSRSGGGGYHAGYQGRKVQPLEYEKEERIRRLWARLGLASPGGAEDSPSGP